MSESRSHKTTANRLATLYNTEYNRGPGADIKAEGITIEVETPETVADAGRQLSGHRGPVIYRGDEPEGGGAGAGPLRGLDHWRHGQSRKYRQAVHAVACGA